MALNSFNALRAKCLTAIARAYNFCTRHCGAKYAAYRSVYYTHSKSSDLIKELKVDGWTLDRVRGSHHVFKHPVKAGHVTVPHPKKGWARGSWPPSASRRVYKEMTMRYPIVIEAGDDATAFGVVVPDLPGCFSAGDTP